MLRFTVHVVMLDGIQTKYRDRPKTREEGQRMSNSKQYPPSIVIEKLDQISIMISDADSSLSDGWAYSGINSLFVGYELLLTLVADGIGWPHPNNPRGSRGIADLLDEEYYPNGFGQTHEHSRAFHRMMYHDSFRIDEALACCKTLYATTSPRS